MTERRAGPPDDERARTLGLIVGSEARRMLSETQLEPDPALVAEGWERRFITDATRLQEVLDLYQSTGFEVRAEPVRVNEMGEDCDDCQLVSLMQFRTIYTRKR